MSQCAERVKDPVLPRSVADSHGRGVSSLACHDDGYQERCLADQRRGQAGPDTHGVIDL